MVIELPVQMPAERVLPMLLGPHRRSPADPTLIIGPYGSVPAGQAWWAVHSSHGPVTVHLHVQDPPAALHDAPPRHTPSPAQQRPHVQAQLWGSGAQEITSRLPAALGCADDTSTFTPGAARVVARAAREHPLLLGRSPSSNAVADALAAGILEQKITLREATSAWCQLTRRYGTVAPRPAHAPADLLASPSPRTWTRIPSWDLHRARVEPRAAKIIQACLSSCSWLTAISHADSERADDLLRAAPGIGPWTSAEVRQRTHADPDAVTLGDLHLPITIGTALSGQPTDDAGMLTLLAAWPGHRHRVTRLLHLAGARRPRFGPRYTPHDFRRS